MNRGGPGLAFAFILASGGAFAQDDGDAMARLRACSLLTPAERTECLEALSRDITRPTAAPATALCTDSRPSAGIVTGRSPSGVRSVNRIPLVPPDSTSTARTSAPGAKP